MGQTLRSEMQLLEITHLMQRRGIAMGPPPKHLEDNQNVSDISAAATKMKVCHAALLTALF